ncbi:DUF2971 domain-containing protein [Metabacillus hrfriensis]|uniref:DUF2971 domain-containing protein n=1 Tax=Metabacillus hrfriensis TaxID=3048891 RepID=A0ACD4RHY7_9BACI|nr:DUF2971 domain-containing protein [Metabacillus sp. CT-WN-B3]WHZ60093.1 DUF2971 domain-containing protein [Metabacillus sp. CT-WN-B3]
MEKIYQKNYSKKEKLERNKETIDEQLLKHWTKIYFNVSNHIPDSLHHYTSLSAAKGILDNRELWLSNVKTMNDPDELSYGYRLIALAMEELVGYASIFGSHQAKLKNLIEVMKHLAEQKVIIGNAEIYLTCFSAAENTIRQWVTYGDTAAGVSIKFANKLKKSQNTISKLLTARVNNTDEDDLSNNLKRDVFDVNSLPEEVKETIKLYEENYYGFKQVEYVEEKNAKSSNFYINLVSSLDRDLQELFRDQKNNDDLDTKSPTEFVDFVCKGAVSRAATSFFIKMALLALSVKHHHWKDEKEWRLILLMHSPLVNNYNIHFLNKPGALVPFIKYFIQPGDIKEICLGPKTNKVISHLALDYYSIVNPKYKDLVIIESNIKMA